MFAAYKEIYSLVSIETRVLTFRGSDEMAAWT